MRNYEPGTPRVAFGIVAVILSTITLGLFVVLPTELEMGAPSPVVVVAQDASS